MNIVRNIISDLVEKKLWPVALGLVAALVVVPMTIAKSGGPSDIATVPPPRMQDDSGPTLDLTRAETTGFARPARVNDKRVDPFGARYDKAFEAALKRYLASTDDVIDASTDGGSNIATDPASGGGGGSELPSPPSGGGTEKPTRTPKPTATPEPETEEDDLLTVLFTGPEGSDAAEPKELTDIRTLTPLPDTENPFLVYVGKTSDGKVTFLVSADATVAGDGACSPSPTDCRTLVMAIGDTADFTAPGKEPNTTQKLSMTVTDLETKDVLVEGDAATEEASQLEAETRAIGAKALKSVLRDEEVLGTLVKRGVKLRT